MSAYKTIFFLGATGYLGSEFLLLLNREFPDLHIVALLRNVTQEREAQLRALYPNSSVVEGTLDDDAVIREQAAKADIVINCASSDHTPSVISTLAGLEINSKNNPGRPPLYLHVSGCGIISDNARGEPVEYVKEWSDIGLDLKEYVLLFRSCNRRNMHLDSDIPIVEAGSRKENPVRTIIYYPGQIYGVGEGIQKTTLWLRIFLDMTKKLGFAGTWGPGANTMNNIHVRDCANGLLLVLKAALEGKADEGPEGLYFSASMEPKKTYHEWTKVMGDVGVLLQVLDSPTPLLIAGPPRCSTCFEKGIINQAGSRPLPNEVVDPLGEYGWSLLGGNLFVKPERLAKLGWEPVETKKTPLLESLPSMIDAALQG
ncbi:hypothetical protein F5J12DRAFT_893474 [Pisolithus orientalis]|uniref:uncharacterized protein n=1 Tax=Pisolithus orientalis TaxID=936130 RepID=UPI002224266B|nr:uncharacterized protein F5J12DRAFT_893474 [Pisolithus orientalis]KAI6004383.1 hypothetical protein F5J12DRAFT_893474 [Pisolithus orientalis]